MEIEYIIPARENWYLKHTSISENLLLTICPLTLTIEEYFNALELQTLRTVLLKKGCGHVKKDPHLPLEAILLLCI